MMQQIKSNIFLSGYSRSVEHRLEYFSRLPYVMKNLGSNFLARATTRGHTEFRLEAPEIGRTGFRSLANLLVGNGVADADVHKFNHLATLQAFKRK